MSDVKIDSLDIKILRMLQGDARKPFQEIAETAKVSTDTIKNRYQTMMKKGLIKGTTIVIDPKEIDQNHIVSIGISVTNPYAEQVLTSVKKITGMFAVTRAVGRYDIEAIAILRDIEQISTVKNTIADFPQVQNVDIEIWVDKPLLCPKNFEFQEDHQ
ncbi:MAG: Lrp/AsnC family transcriptional regulator [Candidatus Thermoplasmatota archaeon]|jgi:Lrp/AsnC family transcriptional regulator for asnA, asnC and gidA|nr:Lrp/AsnC family transcriptional regulator [Candidatus Thermoplasmatota archaeon]